MRGQPALIADVQVRKLEAPMRSSFEIAGGGLDRLQNVLIEVRLRGGALGWGECAPFEAYNGETQKQALAAARAAARWLPGRDAARRESLASELAGRVPCASARAGLEMAVLDAWARQAGVPLWAYFGGAGRRVRIDITVPIVPPGRAAEMGRTIRRFGVRALKVKVGRRAEEDAERVAAACAGARPETLIVDGNAGYASSEALRLLRLLARRGIRPDLFEQPVRKDDLDGMAEVARKGGSAVAADESAASPADVLRLARRRAAQVVNLKLMKAGVSGSWAMARVARSAGLGLMIGGNVESSLAMTCSAHLAAGFGGFRYVDLDTPLLLSKEPLRGVRIRRGGIYDLSRVRGGIGVEPI